MHLDAELIASLPLVVTAMAAARHDWWLIGSAAVALHGGDAAPVRDVDVLIDLRDTAALSAVPGVEVGTDQGHEIFRSDWFGRLSGAPLPIELFAGFSVMGPGGWSRITLATRLPVVCGPATLFVPERQELVALLHCIGRGKDLARAASLIASAPSPSTSGTA